MIYNKEIPGVALSDVIPSGQAREWRNNPAIWKWCRQNTLISETAQHEWWEKIHTDPTLLMFGIKASDQFVGVCGLTSIDRINQKAELSLYIAQNFQGRGYELSAMLLLLNHGFNDQNLNKIWVEIFDGNPSHEMYWANGFETEGILKDAYFREGKFIKAHLLAMHRSRFNELYSHRLGHGDKRPSADSQSDARGGFTTDLGADTKVGIWDAATFVGSWLRENGDPKKRELE